MPKFIDRTGETNLNTQGLKMTIIAYHGANHIDVQFEDGSIRNDVTYNSFQRKNLLHPSVAHTSKRKAQLRIGETIKNHQGITMKIISYRSSTDIDVQTENGIILTHKTYRHFKNGGIEVLNSDLRIGEQSTAKNGMKMKIIAYRRCNDIDVQFEDGYIVVGTSYTNFRSGYIRHPDCRHGYNPKTKYLGKSEMMRNGQLCKIIAYRDYYDIDVQFEDGTVVTSVGLDRFTSKSIGNPNFDSRIAHNHLFERNIANCGIPMQIIKYVNGQDITIKFETGYIHNCRYNGFHTGGVAHPFPYEIGNITMESPAYIYKDEGNFYCKCNKCGIRDIMSIREIKDHKCIAQ